MAAYSHRVNAPASSMPAMDTSMFFDLGHRNSSNSPIDNFFEKATLLNLIQVKFLGIPSIDPSAVDHQLNLILLGYISAVESYYREVIRRLIILDRPSRIACENQQVNYGAVLNSPAEMLPESLLEKTSFASKSNVTEAIKNYLGIAGHITNELVATLNEFEQICQFRHCVIHRFGKLGSNNAIKLGLEKHSQCLEKPLKLDPSKLFQVYLICENTVLVSNDYIFKKIIDRTTTQEHLMWTYDLRRDKPLFKKYYDLFYCSSKPATSTSLQIAYNALKIAKKTP